MGDKQTVDEISRRQWLKAFTTETWMRRKFSDGDAGVLGFQ